MPTYSSLARLQQAVVAVLALAAVAWFARCWPQHPWMGLAGVLACMFVHTPVLALEHLLLMVTWGADPAPRPRLRALAGAWARESWQGLRVFGWRQPFAWRREPDWVPDGLDARGIVFIHGFVCNRGFWTPWLQRCRAAGIPFIAVNLEPVHGPIDAYAATVDAAVRRLQQATGRAPVLVAHSMGGLVARAWLRSDPSHRARVAHIVTIGTPHRGTWLARFSHLPNGRQMRIGGAWLDLLGALPAPAGLYTCWWGNADNIVFPPSTATLPGADNRMVAGAAHVDLAFRPAVLQGTLDLVRAL